MATHYQYIGRTERTLPLTRYGPPCKRCGVLRDFHNLTTRVGHDYVSPRIVDVMTNDELHDRYAR